MEPRPLIGITGHLEPARWGDWVREAVVSPASYARAVYRAGGIPLVLPPIPADAVADLVRGLGGLIMSAGSDVDPQLYGERPNERTSDPDSRRDRFELSIIRAVIKADLPFLAIGRGMHVLNVALGGSLIQYLPTEVGHIRHAPGPGNAGSHGIRISGDCQLGRILGTTATVPASHHQAVRRLGDGLSAVAWADDQVVEAVELTGNPFGVGVQWRPEDGDDPRLLGAFVNAAAQAALAGAPNVVGHAAAGKAAAGKAAAGQAEERSTK